MSASFHVNTRSCADATEYNQTVEREVHSWISPVLHRLSVLWKFILTEPQSLGQQMRHTAKCTLDSHEVGQGSNEE